MANNEKTLICDDCGTTENVFERQCPFAKEINKTIVDVDLCSHCYGKRCESI